jgi:site-specific DNA-methyltransferase (adenine-specific)
MDLNQIYCGDNLPLLKEWEQDGVSFDLVLTDPPYNVGKDFGNNTDRQSRDDFLQFMDDRLFYTAELMKQRSNLVLFCSHLYNADMQVMLRDWLTYQRQLIWYYRNGLSRQTKSPVTEYEPMLWYTKWGSDVVEPIYNGDDVRVPYRSDRVKTPVYKKNKNGEKVGWNPDPRGARKGDVWEYPCLAGKLYEAERTEHQTQKPESLITDLLKAFCPKNDKGEYEGTVLDPFCGSGTVPVCCEKLNRLGHKITWVGIELEPKWVNVGRERLASIDIDYIM